MKKLLEIELDKLTDKANVLGRAYKINFERRAGISEQLWSMQTGIHRGDTVELYALNPEEAGGEYATGIVDVITMNPHGSIKLVIKTPTNPDKDISGYEITDLSKFRIVKV